MTSLASEPILSTADELLHRLLATDDGRQDPYPLYRQLRQQAPLFRSSLDGLWYASRYDDTKALLVDPRAGRANGGGMVARYNQNPAMTERFARRMRASMLLQNPPEHTRLRGVVSRSFTPRRVAGLAARIEELAEPMLDDLADAGDGADAMALLAFRLPVAVIGELVGVPAGDREQFRALVNTTQAISEPGAPPEAVAAADEAAAAIESYFVALAAERRRRPTDDLLSALIEQRDDEDNLSEEEMLSTTRLLFGAGFLTTTNLIGNGLLTFFRHPDEQRRLWDDPSLAATAVDEILRYESPIQQNGRSILEPLEVAGVPLAAGETVLVLVGGANRDPERFPDPERFDIGRRGEAALSFGWGIHHCLGAPLARLEGQIVFRRFTERFSSMELAGPEPKWNTAFLRGLDSLPVRVKPR